VGIGFVLVVIPPTGKFCLGACVKGILRITPVHYNAPFAFARLAEVTVMTVGEFDSDADFNNDKKK